MPKSHIHKLKRVTLGTDYEVYRCMVTGCTTYYATTMSVGLITQCWSCLKPFEFSGRNLRQVKPKCLDCSGKQKETRESRAADSLLERLRGIKL